MSPAEYIALLQDGMGLVAGDAMNFASLMFAYVVAAYYAAARLGRAQAWFLSVLYTVFLALPVMSALSGWGRIQALRQMFTEEHPVSAMAFFERSSSPPPGFAYYLALLFLSGWIMSILFMVSERVKMTTGD